MKNINVEYGTTVTFKSVCLYSSATATVNYVETKTSRWGWDTFIHSRDNTNYPDRQFIVRSQERELDFNRAILLIDIKSSGSYEEHYIATQDYVISQIQGAINSSY